MQGVKKEFQIAIRFVFLLALVNFVAIFCEAAPAPSTKVQTQEYPSSDSPSAGPSISTQPTSQNVTAGQTATFTVVATGTQTLTYQWMLNGAAISGATSPSYTTSAVAASDNGGKFSVTISDATGNVTSSIATLTVNKALRAEQSAPSPSDQNPPVRTSRVFSNTYIGVQVGSINYAFSNAQLLPGFQAQSIQVGHLATRLTLFGHEFNKYLSGEVNELVTAHSIVYENVNGVPGKHPLWMNNIAGFTLKARLPLSQRWSLFGEGGLGVVTRNGFKVNQATALNETNYATFLFGGGVAYRINDNWDILSGITVVPGQSENNQPITEFFSGGFTYTLRRVPAEPAREESPDGPIWPRNIVHIGYITNALGYDVNNFFTTGKIAIFWHGSVEAANGVSVDYQRNAFHTRRFFALDWGVSVSTFTARLTGERFFTAALYPVLRIPLIRTNPVEFYFAYSLAGPALITRTTIDGQSTGKVFTFQDYMALGIYLGRQRRVTSEVRIGHYSNANLFSQNPGITIPLGFYFGTTF